MHLLKNSAATARIAAIAAIGGLALTGCVTQDYIDQQFAGVNSRIDQLDARVQTAAQRADAANQAAQSANQAAQAAAADARSANQRIDQLEGRISQIQSGPARTPRG